MGGGDCNHEFPPVFFPPVLTILYSNIMQGLSHNSFRVSRETRELVKQTSVRKISCRLFLPRTVAFNIGANFAAMTQNIPNARCNKSPQSINKTEFPRSSVFGAKQNINSTLGLYNYIHPSNKYQPILPSTI